MSEVIPEGWTISTIEQITANNSLFCDGDWVESKDQDPTGNNRLIQLADVGDGTFLNKSARFMNDEQFQRLQCTELRPNDILIARMPDPLGRACMYKQGSQRAATVVDVAILRTENANHYWLMSAINSQNFRFQIELNASGTTRTRIARGILSQIEVLTPPLHEQQKIATILSSVDDMIEKTRAQIDKLKDLKTGVMQEFLTQGIGHTEFKDSPVGRIPASWGITDLRSVVIRDGLQTGPFGSQLHAHEYIEWGIPVVMPKDMSDNRVDTSSIARISPQKADELKKHSVRPGDILFSRRGDIGRFVLITKKDEGFICGTGCLRARLSEVVSPSYLACYLTLSKIVEWLNANAVGQTMLNLNTSILGNLPVVLPSKPEQDSIGQTVVALEENIQLNSAKLWALEKHKKALMQDLLTGKVRVKLDPPEVAAA